MEQHEKPTYFVPTPGKKGMTELHYAAYCGDAEGIDLHLRAGADPNEKDDFGWTALHWNARMSCVHGERLEVIDLLIRGGANVNSADHQGRTPLDHAIFSTAPREHLRHLRRSGGVTAEPPE